MVATRRKKKVSLRIVELAVDPGDVDEERYPVRLRLTRPLTSYEAEGLALAEPGLRLDGDSIVVPDARLDDIARDHGTWSSRLERVESLAAELEGESMIADQRRMDQRVRHGSRLESQQEQDRGLH